jgi:hypothetical protein
MCVDHGSDTNAVSGVEKSMVGYSLCIVLPMCFRCHIRPLLIMLKVEFGMHMCLQGSKEMSWK